MNVEPGDTVKFCFNKEHIEAVFVHNNYVSSRCLIVIKDPNKLHRTYGLELKDRMWSNSFDSSTRIGQLIYNQYKNNPSLYIDCNAIDVNYLNKLHTLEDQNKCSPLVSSWPKLKTRRLHIFSAYTDSPSKYINNDHIIINLSAQPYTLEELVVQLLFEVA